MKPEKKEGYHTITLRMPAKMYWRLRKKTETGKMTAYILNAIRKAMK